MGLNESCASVDFEHYAPFNRDVRQVARGATAPDKSRTLARIIEADIIPRLLLANGAEEARSVRKSTEIDVDDEDIDAFADMMINLELGRAHSVVSSALSRGVGLDAILLKILSPTAKRLGERWEDDRCTFTDVTVGLCGLQSLLRSFETAQEDETGMIPVGAAALVTSLPGEQHTFGALLVESFLRRAGWETIGMPLGARADILSAVARRSFKLVALSLSRDDELDRMQSLITAIRRQSLNPEVVVMVGGGAFNGRPDRVTAVGADMTATDGREAAIASQHILCSRLQSF